MRPQGMGPATMATECRYDDRAALAVGVATRVAVALEAALEHRERASLVVPGGTTPGPIFDELALTPIAWSHVDVTLSDERWVPADHAESNERLVRHRLLHARAASAHLIGLHRPRPKPSDALPEIEATLGKIGRPFDVVLLGMGSDGHFASLFPGRQELQAGLDRTNSAQVIALDAPANGHPRVSLSLSAILNAQLILVLFQGMEKHAVLESAKTPESALDLPIRALLNQDVAPVEVHWAS
jgi:6-phosphogluconolactonase